jgi:hypothetical protein
MSNSFRYAPKSLHDICTKYLKAFGSESIF